MADYLKIRNKEKILAEHRKKVSEARRKVRLETLAKKKAVEESWKGLEAQEAARTLAEKLQSGLPPEKLNLTPAERKVALKQLELIKAERERRLKHNNLVKFCPNGKQEELIKAVGRVYASKDTAGIVTLFGGNGVGKTSVAVNILGNIIWGPQPFLAKSGTLEEYCDINNDVNWVDEWGDPPKYWCKGKMYEEFPFPKVIRIISDPANLDDEGAIQVEIDKWWPKGKYKGSKGKYDYRSKIQTDNGWSIELKTYEQPKKEHESKTCGIIWADEPIPYHLWGATISRFRLGGMLLMTMTPLFASPFIYNQIVRPTTDKTIYYTFADVEDNCREHGVRGILTHDRVEWLIGQYPPREREARKTGKFVSLSGRVHAEFSRDIHVVKSRETPESIPSRDFILANKHLFEFYQVVDPHDRKPDVVGYYALDDNNRKYVIDEFPDRRWPMFHEMTERRYTWKQLIEKELIPKERKMGFEPGDIIRIMDPRYAHNRSQRGAGRSGLKIIDEWESAYGEGFIAELSDNMSLGINKLDQNLMVAGDGFPMIIFFEPYANNHIYSLENWLYDEWEGKTEEKRNIKTTPQEKNSDFGRNLHYLCVYDPNFSKRGYKMMGWREKLKQKKYTKKPAITWMGM